MVFYGAGITKDLVRRNHYIYNVVPFAWVNQLISKISDVLELVDALQLNIKRNTFTLLTSWPVVFKG